MTEHMNLTAKLTERMSFATSTLTECINTVLSLVDFVVSALKRTMVLCNIFSGERLLHTDLRVILLNP